MRNLSQVDEAKSVMREAMEWSVVRWLKEKRRVRKLADRANAALDELDREIKASWPAELQAAYAALSNPGPDHSRRDDSKQLDLTRRVKRADDSAARARAAAEKTFDDAEDQLSARLARAGCLQAIQSWELHEQAIRLAECGAGVSPANDANP